jgi:hypothetical protein
LAGFPAKLFAVNCSPWNPNTQLGRYMFVISRFQPFYPPGRIPLWLFPNTFGCNFLALTHYPRSRCFCYLLC